MIIWMIVGCIIILFGFVTFRGAPYVPSQRRYVRQAFRELYPLTNDDVLVDVGSGDGIVLRLASECGARAIGYELNPLLVVLSRLLSRGDARVSVRLVDFWLTPLPKDITIVYGFMVTRDMKKMTAKMQKEANRLGRPLYFMTYGNPVKGREYVATLSAYYLYTFQPLQGRKA